MTVNWQHRYDSAKPSYTKRNEKKFADLEAGTSVLIPSPADIEVEINAIASDTTVSLTELRDALAERHNADGTCPVMCGMNLRVVAEVTFEALDGGVDATELTPVWNAIAPDSALAGKVPGGARRIASLRWSATS